MVDETIDAKGYVTSIVNETLLTDRPGDIFFFLNAQQLEKTNNSKYYISVHCLTIQFVYNSLMVYYRIRRHKVLLFLSDTAPNMVKLSDTSKVLYTKMVYVTCILHGLHRVFEYIHIQYPKIHKLVANVKKKYSERHSLYYKIQSSDT